MLVDLGGPLPRPPEDVEAAEANKPVGMGKQRGSGGVTCFTAAEGDPSLGNLSCTLE